MYSISLVVEDDGRNYRIPSIITPGGIFSNAQKGAGLLEGVGVY